MDRSSCISRAVRLATGLCGLAVAAPAADCNQNGVDDTLDVAPVGFGLVLKSGLATLRYAQGLTLLDADGDARLDFIVTATSDAPRGYFHRGAGPFQWDAERAFAISPEHWGLTAGDLDRDGLADAVTWGSSALAVHWGERREGVERGPILAVHAFPQDVEAADVTGDGLLDLLAANSLGLPDWPQTISVLVNEGSRSFQAGRNYASAQGAIEIEPGDFDLDGDVDLATLGESLAAQSRFSLVVLRNDGAGAFLAQVPSPETEQSSRAHGGTLEGADLDGDGDQDLATLDSGSSIALLHNNGQGVIAKAGIVETAAYVSSFLLDDLTGDRLPDLIVPGEGCGVVQVWRSQGGGALSEPAAYPAMGNPRRLAAADLDLDGDADLAAYDSGWGELLVLESSVQGPSRDCNEDSVPDECEIDCNGSGHPDDCDLAWGTSRDCDRNGAPDECDPDCDRDGVPDACALREHPDLDRDANGIPDACDGYDGTSQDCNGNAVADELDLEPRFGLVQRIHSIPEGLAELAVADLDDDGFADVVAASAADSWQGRGVQLLRNLRRASPGPDFARSWLLSGEEGQFSSGSGAPFELADLDGDGGPDIVVLELKELCVSSRSAAVLWLEGTGGRVYRRRDTIATLASAPPVPTDLVAADISGDGELDLIAVAGAVWVLEGQGGGSFAPPERLHGNAGDKRFFLATGDCNADGRLDLVLDTGVVLFLRGRYDVDEGEVYSEGGVRPAVGDFDGDGDADIATPAGISLSDGRGAFEEVLELARRTSALTSSDLSADGVPDVAATSGGPVEVLIHTGAGFARASYRTLSDSAHRVLIGSGDLDGDAASDLVVADTDTRLTYLLNRGDGAFAGRRAHDVETNYSDLLVADVDADGDRDIVTLVGRSPEPSELGVRRNDGSGELGATEPTLVESGGSSLAAARVDVDEHLDLLVGTERGWELLPGDGGGAFPRRTGILVDGGLYGVAAADMNGDGRLDLLGAGRTTETLWRAEQHEGMSFEVKPLADIPDASWTQPFLAADLDADSDLDLALLVAGAMEWRANDGNGNLGEPRPLGVERPICAAAADLDGDARLDLVACVSGLHVLLQREPGQLELAHHLPREPQAYSLGVGDLDLDGDLDLVLPWSWISGGDVFQSEHVVEILLNGGKGELGSWGLAPTGIGPSVGGVADLDGDGYPEIVAVAEDSGFTILDNWTAPPVETDADGDAILDGCERAPFRRGDWNQDRRTALSDPVALLGFLFLGRPGFGCDDAGDANDDGRLTIADAVWLLSHLFLGRRPPPPPLECGIDPGPDDELSCANFDACEASQ